MAKAPRSLGAAARRAVLAIAATWAAALPQAPAEAQVCLDCFTETLGANPFTAPLVLPTQFLWTGTLGLAGPYDDASWLPNFQAKYGLMEGLELLGTLGYEPSLGTRARIGALGDATLLGAARVGYAYFRSEWLAGVTLPVLWTPGPGWLLRLEPQLTINQVTGNHVALEAALSRLLAPGTSLALTVAPDYRLAEEIWTGSASLAVSRSLSPRWAAYVLASMYVVDRPTPLVAAGLTYLPLPRE